MLYFQFGVAVSVDMASPDCESVIIEVIRSNSFSNQSLKPGLSRLYVSSPGRATDQDGTVGQLIRA